MNKVLILDGGAVHAMAVAECLNRSGYSVAVACDNRNEYGYHCKYVDERFLGLDSHHKQYAGRMIEFLQKHHFDVLIPTSDTAAEFMSFNKDELRQVTGILMPDPVIFMKGYDKNQLMRTCKDNGFPHPETIDLSDGLISEGLEDFPYPGLLKPNLTSGGRGMTLVNSISELKMVFPTIKKQYGDCHLQRFVSPGGKQVKVQIMTDAGGELKYSSVIWKQRYYPVNGGSSCCNVTIDSPETVEVCAKVLKALGWIGFADFDLIEDSQTEKLLIMELNPRIPACIRSALKSGVDYATMIADATLGLPLRDYHYEPGKRLRHLGFDFLWFMKSPNRFKSESSWFDFFGKDLYYQDFLSGNFGSFFWGTWGNLKKQLNSEFRQSKSGVNLKMQL